MKPPDLPLAFTPYSKKGSVCLATNHQCTHYKLHIYVLECNIEKESLASIDVQTALTDKGKHYIMNKNQKG